ncbi:MAG: hypothetical protein J0M17_06940 [Planctomycetes bacterium]|nr:hypothetical protein [Planctomycetota bacterium]
MFLLQASEPGIKPAEANEAAWTVGYILGPVIMAFVSFHLGPNAEANLTADSGRRIRTSQLAMALVITLAAHGIVMLYFFMNVWNKSFSFPATADGSYLAAVTSWFKILLFFGAMPIVAVNFLLGRTDVAFPAQTMPSQPKGDQS